MQISSVWNSSLCFQMRGTTGGELESCDGSPAQKWTLKKKATESDAGAAAQYQIVGSAGQCVTDVSTAPDADLATAATAAAASAATGNAAGLVRSNLSLLSSTTRFWLP